MDSTREDDTATTDGGGDEMEKFYTTPAASAGVKLDLVDPMGRRTNHWLLIIGADSDEFRLADAAAKRRAVEISSIQDDRERDKAIMYLERDLTAYLVKSWSFSLPCTHENVVGFFKNAPQIQNAVDHAAVTRALFYKVKLND